MALNFPSSPTLGPPPTEYGRWVWTGVGWGPKPTVSAPMLPIAGGTVTGNLGVQGTTSLTGTLTALGHSEINTLQVNGQADFIDGVSIDGDPAATEPYVDSEIAAVKNLGFFSGSFDTHADLPANASAIAHLTANDFVTVRADETRGGATTRYIASAIAADGTITWTYDMTYSTDVSGKMDKVPAATQGHVAIFDNAGQVEDAGSDLQAATLQFRPMTPNIRNWIPVGVEGVFVGEGTNILNAPTTGTWRYLAFAKASGALNLIAFEDAGGPMRASSTANAHQRVARSKRNGGVANATDGWSSYGNDRGLTAGWGEYQRPLFSDEGNWQRANLMKLGGRNLLARVAGGNINFGPRNSGPPGFRNSTNLSLRHARLVETGASGSPGLNRMHLIENIWRLEEGSVHGYIKDVRNVTRARWSFNIDLSPWHQPTGRRWTRYIRLTQPGAARFPVNIGFNVGIPGAQTAVLYLKRFIVVLDCRTLGSGARWVRADGTLDATDANMTSGMAFSPNTSNLRVEFITSNVSADTSPAGKIYQIEFDGVAYGGIVTARVHAFSAPPYSSNYTGGT